MSVMGAGGESFGVWRVLYMSQAEIGSNRTSESEGLGIDNFTVPERRAVYRAIYERRDIRHFRTDPIPDDALARIIQAAHHGPSVGFMQPWDFILIKDAPVRRQVKDLFERERQAASCFFDEPRSTCALPATLPGPTKSLEGTLSPKPTSTRPVARSRTCGWPLVVRA